MSAGEWRDITFSADNLTHRRQIIPQRPDNKQIEYSPWEKQNALLLWVCC